MAKRAVAATISSVVIPAPTTIANNESSQPKASSKELLPKRLEASGILQKRLASTFTSTIFYFNTITTGSTLTKEVTSTINAVVTVVTTQTSTSVVGATSTVTVSSTVTTTSTITSTMTQSTSTITPGNGNTQTEVSQTITPTNSIPVLQPNSGTLLSSGLSGAAISVIFLLLELFPLI
jgi:hypothetical protein